MSGQTINYEHLAKEALRTVVKNVLKQIVKDGLPGDHHFYISFHTTAEGVKISNRISAQYPKEMTIVLQHQFWDLKVEEEHFEVRLSFSNIPELLIIPYSAVKVFFDPSVPYGLQFDQSTRPEAVEDKTGFLEERWHLPTEKGEQTPDNINHVTDLAASAPKDEEETDQTSTIREKANERSIKLSDTEKTPNDQSHEDTSDKPEQTQKSDEGDTDGAEIVSLDAFRKKNN